jgi:hypothetical protein
MVQGGIIFFDDCNLFYVKLMQYQKAYLCLSKYLIPGPMKSYLNPRIIEK